MKLIKISTDLELTVHDFPTGTHSEQNDYLRGLIGNDCELYEHVMPERLYTDLKMKDRPTKIPGQCVSMLIDEEGRLKQKPQILLGVIFIKQMYIISRLWEMCSLSEKNGTMMVSTSADWRRRHLSFWNLNYTI